MAILIEDRGGPQGQKDWGKDNKKGGSQVPEGMVWLLVKRENSARGPGSEQELSLVQSDMMLRRPVALQVVMSSGKAGISLGLSPTHTESALL